MTKLIVLLFLQFLLVASGSSNLRASTSSLTETQDEDEDFWMGMVRQLASSMETIAPTLAARSDTSARAMATSDPHFYTWRGSFSYQGACDVIFIETERLSVHLRMSFQNSARRFSFVSNAAVEIEGDVIEILTNKTLYINGEIPSSVPSTVGGGYPFTFNSNGMKIQLAGGQYIEASYYRGTLTVKAVGFATEFGTSVGLAGSYYSNVIPGRGITNMTGPSDYANEWKVDPALGDLELFVEPSLYANGTCQEALTFTSTPAEIAEAEAECAELTDATAREYCIFDILASRNTAFAANPAYTEIEAELESICIEANETTSECESFGGSCTWRCDDIDNVCYSGLCSYSDDNFTATDEPLAGQVEGCSCAVPIPEATSESINEFMTCIAVIDESSQSAYYIATKWEQFRTEYPNRRFCLLQPTGYPVSYLHIPTSFYEDGNTIYSGVSRDYGSASSASDWYDICKLDELRRHGIDRLALFVDNSGSLTVGNVQGSINLLNSHITSRNLTLVNGIYNSYEDWVGPFISDFV